ncbi:MAG: rSAM-modified peptide [bacterium]|nr:rSAM-modified peptide [bacterium]
MKKTNVKKNVRNTKLSLNKETIAQLKGGEMKDVKGGYHEPTLLYTIFQCETDGC